MGWLLPQIVHIDLRLGSIFGEVTRIREIFRLLLYWHGRLDWTDIKRDLLPDMHLIKEVFACEFLALLPVTLPWFRVRFELDDAETLLVHVLHVCDLISDHLI